MQREYPTYTYRIRDGKYHICTATNAVGEHGFVQYGDDQPVVDHFGASLVVDTLELATQIVYVLNTACSADVTCRAQR
jgi:hypothetical protein